MGEEGGREGGMEEGRVGGREGGRGGEGGRREAGRGRDKREKHTSRGKDRVRDQGKVPRPSARQLTHHQTEGGSGTAVLRTPAQSQPPLGTFHPPRGEFSLKVNQYC